MKFPVFGDKWKHWESQIEYIIVCIARDEETQELQVVYMQENDYDRVWVRSLSSFMSLDENRNPKFVIVE